MILNKVKLLLSGQFMQNVGWLGTAELANRIFRLGTTVTLARMFSSQDYGAMAVVYTIFEFANVLTMRGGIGAKIIQADEQHLQVICNTSYWLNWILCGSIFLLQCAAAYPIAKFYNNEQLIFPICALALMYLMFPLFMVNAALIERENRLKITALCNAMQSFIANSVTVAFAILGMGVWAIVWSMVLSTPVWIIITWRNNSWRPPKYFTLERLREVIHFGKNMLGIELLHRVRSNLDYLIIGRLLGMNALGIYYFAFNAGSGITMNVVTALISALYPYICAVRGDFIQLKTRYFSSFKRIMLIVVPIVSLQSILAPLYVPIIFGQKWVTAIPILIIICLSVLPRAWAWTNSILLNAIDKTQINLYISIGYTAFFGVAILIAAQWGIFWVAVAVLVSNLIFVPISALWTYRYVFNKDKYSGSSLTKV